MLAATGAVFILGVLLYMLYINGYIVVNAKRAFVFIGSMGRNRSSCRATFSTCHGYMKRIVRFKENREYSFNFDSEIRKGTVSVELQNANRQTILVLNHMNQMQSIHLNRKSRYYLVINFDKASGKYELKWD